MDKYNNLISRQIDIVPVETQKNIRNCKVLLLGCGLGSQIGVLAARTGFENFILVDGDDVEEHNLNRQAFDRSHIGKNKAESLSLLIKGINPDANVECRPFFLTDKITARGMINSVDVVINMVDPGEIMYFINDYSQDRGKLVVFPLNVMWGCYVMFFTPNSKKLVEILGGEKIKGNIFYIEFLKKTMVVLPSSVTNFCESNKNDFNKMEFMPQLGAASFVNAAIVIAGIVRWVSGYSIVESPSPVFEDLLSFHIVR